MHVDTIDDFCSANRIPKIDILKIDTEGFDLNVLKGAKQMLSRGQIAFIYTEFNDCVAKQGITGGALNEITNYWPSLSFIL